ncbi:RNA-directed DNA polymerase (reverse transcriptase)-related family protein, partial [Thalictrum thalictroides]
MDCSWAWRGIMETRQIMKEFVQYSVAKGNLSFWHAPWSGYGILRELFSTEVRRRSRIRDNTLVSSFIHNGQWERPENVIPEMQHIWDSIMASRISHEDNDRFIWTPHPRGIFTINTAYEVMRTHGTKLQWCKQMWRPHCVPRHAFISWLTVQGALTTQDKLVDWRTRHISNCMLCNPFFSFNSTNIHCLPPLQNKPHHTNPLLPPICSPDLYAHHNITTSTSMRNWATIPAGSSLAPVGENEHHLFFDCPWSQKVWKEVQVQCGIRRDIKEADKEWKWILEQFKGNTLHNIVLQTAVTTTV